MNANKDYDPGVYRRLQLVEKQLKNSTAEQKRLEAAEKRQVFWQNIGQNKTRIGRYVLYAILGMVLVAVIVVLILAKT